MDGQNEAISPRGDQKRRASRKSSATEGRGRSDRPERSGDASRRDQGRSPRQSQKPLPPYNFKIDLKTDNTHANVIHLVGHAQRVLELGPASGYMSKILKERDCAVVGIELEPTLARRAAAFCERMIIGDIDALDFEAELGEDRFDVIVAADVLEHLKDPLGALTRLRRFLKPEGFFVVSLPNVAHASVRLALLQGRFEYRDLGLIDRTHLRFFTHETIKQLFDDAELAIVQIHRQEAPIAIEDAPVDLGTVPEAVIGELENDPDARTYQFVIKAVSLELPGLRELQSRIHEQALLADTAERDRTMAQQELSLLREQVHEQLTTISARERELRVALVDAHDQLLRRDEEIEKLHGNKNRLEGEVAELSDARDRRAELEKQLEEQREHYDAHIVFRDEEIRRLKVRLDRILNSPPARAYARVSRLPVLRRIAGRRTAGYERALRHAEQRDD
jgi:2-polyprenyl-3-methyl-5-hydroxy-6-metoxy-1,4-benzoquinol methylase